MAFQNQDYDAIQYLEDFIKDLRDSGRISDQEKVLCLIWLEKVKIELVSAKMVLMENMNKVLSGSQNE